MSPCQRHGPVDGLVDGAVVLAQLDDHREKVDGERPESVGRGEMVSRVNAPRTIHPGYWITQR